MQQDTFPPVHRHPFSSLRLPLIGPISCGKTTLLRSINGLSDLVKGTRHNGDIKLSGQSVFLIKPDVGLYLNRRLCSQVIHDLNAVNVALCGR
jgi:ABC-type phosphate transport system ATPase subunit